MTKLNNTKKARQEFLKTLKTQDTQDTQEVKQEVKQAKIYEFRQDNHFSNARQVELLKKVNNDGIIKIESNQYLDCLDNYIYNCQGSKVSIAERFNKAIYKIVLLIETSYILELSKFLKHKNQDNVTIEKVEKTKNILVLKTA